MPLSALLNKGPRQFIYFHRLMGYAMLSLLLVVYHYTAYASNYQIFVPVFLLLLILVEPTMGRWIEQKYSKDSRKQIFFLLDAIVVSTALAAVHLSLVLTFIILLAFIYSAINSRISLLMASLAILLGCAVFYFNTIFIFGFSSYFGNVSPELTALSLLSLIIFINLGNYFQLHRIGVISSQRQYYFDQMNRYINLGNQLARYAPVQLWQAIMHGETEAKIEYRRRKLTVFFSDIEGFTDLSESLIPDDLAFLLNDYLSHMTDIAKQYGGTVDKFMGDAVLVFFGDPQSKGAEQDAKACVEMALAMRQQMRLLRERWQNMGYPALYIRMGVSTGYCHVGNYGSTHRMAYTIVGRDVNLAARLQYAAQTNEILVSDETYRLIKNEFLCVPKSPVKLKGIQEMVNTWQILEKYSAKHVQNQQWFDYEYKGFNLLLNLEDVQNFEYPELIQVMETMIARIKVQQQLLNPQGVAKLHLKDEVKQPD